MDEFLTIDQVATLLQVSTWTIRKMIKEEKIKCKHIGARGMIRIHKSDLMDYYTEEDK